MKEDEERDRKGLKVWGRRGATVEEKIGLGVENG